MIQCPECELYQNCPGPDDERCPNHEDLKDNDDGFTDIEREALFVEYDDNTNYYYSGGNIPPSRDEQILELYFVRRKTQVKIAEKLSITQSCVSKVVSKHRPILIDAIKSSADNS